LRELIYHGLAAPDEELKQRRALVAAQELRALDDRPPLGWKTEAAQRLVRIAHLMEAAGVSPAQFQATMATLRVSESAESD
jgi:hypothetical protein